MMPTAVFVIAVGLFTTVAAVVVPDRARSTKALEEEEERLRTLFGGEVVKLVYGVTARRDRPLEVERVPEGELL